MEGGGEAELHGWLSAGVGRAALGSAEPSSLESALPFLLKVLSIARALSVQAHPDLKLAAALHAARPDVYKDANHKPELACALTPFEAMAGFRAPADLLVHLRSAPELVTLVGTGRVAALEAAAAADGAGATAEGGSPAFRAALRDAYTSFSTASETAVAAATAALAVRLAANLPPATPSLSSSPPSADAVAARLLRDFPGDIGVFAPYLLNVLKLAPGEALFLAANEPHAYLSGDCVEVMACSDNVVRAGLTPKYRDVSTLCSMLTYAAAAPRVLAGSAVDACTVAYAAPVPEFLLQRTELPAEAYALPTTHAAAVLIVLDGTADAVVHAEPLLADADGRALAAAAPAGERVQKLSAGSVWLQPANATITLRRASGGAPTIIFRAMPNPAFA